MFYPASLNKEANQVSQMGNQIANFLRNLSVPTSINNAVRPQILKRIGTLSAAGGAGMYLGNIASTPMDNNNTNNLFQQGQF